MTEENKKIEIGSIAKDLLLDAENISGFKTIAYNKLFDNNGDVKIKDYREIDEKNNLIFVNKRSGEYLKIVIDNQIKNIYPQSCAENFYKLVKLFKFQDDIKIFWSKDKPLLFITSNNNLNYLLFLIAPHEGI